MPSLHDLFLFFNQHMLLILLFIIILFILINYDNLMARWLRLLITPPELVQLINHDRAVLVDIRSKDLFNKNHIKLSNNIPANEIIDKIDLLKQLSHAHHKTVVITCGQGYESLKVALKLHKKNISPIKILSGGLSAWSDANLPLEKL